MHTRALTPAPACAQTSVISVCRTRGTPSTTARSTGRRREPGDPSAEPPALPSGSLSTLPEPSDSELTVSPDHVGNLAHPPPPPPFPLAF